MLRAFLVCAFYGVASFAEARQPLDADCVTHFAKFAPPSLDETALLRGFYADFLKQLSPSDEARILNVIREAELRGVSRDKIFREITGGTTCMAR